MATITNLEDFMDIVYTYKCKFCTFSCGSIAGVGEHIVSEHQQSTDFLSKLVHKPEPQTDDCGLSVEAARTEVPESNETKNALTNPNSTEESGALNGTTAIVDDAVQRHDSTTAGTGDHVYTVSDKSVRGADIVAESFSMAVGKITPNEEDEDVEMESTASVAVPISNTGVLPGIRLEEEPQLGSTEVTQSVLPSPDIKDEGVSELREYFVCGQCNVAFTSMPECEKHVQKEHGVSIQNDAPTVESRVTRQEQETTGSESDEVRRPGCKVSVATQVETYKKPGRKRKLERPDEDITGEGPEGQAAASDTNDIKEVSLLSSQYIQERESQGKRRIRLPKMLQDEYLVTRRLQCRPRITLDPANIHCNVAGCQAKFRTTQALTIHSRCHCENYLKNPEGNTEENKEGVRIKIEKDEGMDSHTDAGSLCPQGFICVECSERFSKWRPLRLHLWAKHGIDVDLLKCEKCDFRTDRPQKLELHMEIHSDDKPYVCKICGRGYQQLAQLRNHELSHKKKDVEIERRWYHSKKCHLCNRVLSDSKSLKKHIETVHEKLKPYTCDVCGHSTSQKHMMIVHKRTHTGEKPHSCDICNFQTSDHNTLRRHRMRHTGQKPYSCQYCSYSCIQAVSLKIHMKNKHPNSEGLYYCETCHYNTVSQSSWLQHQENHANGLIEPQDKGKTIVAARRKASYATQDTGAGVGVQFVDTTPPVAEETNGVETMDSQTKLNFTVVSEAASETGRMLVESNVPAGVHSEDSDLKGSVLLDQTANTRQINYVYLTVGNSDSGDEVIRQPVVLQQLTRYRTGVRLQSLSDAGQQVSVDGQTLYPVKLVSEANPGDQVHSSDTGLYTVSMESMPDPDQQGIHLQSLDPESSEHDNIVYTIGNALQDQAEPGTSVHIEGGNLIKLSSGGANSSGAATILARGQQLFSGSYSPVDTSTA